MDFGCIISNLTFIDRNGKVQDLVLGYDNFQGYENDSNMFGATIGRYAGRIKNGRYKLNGIDLFFDKNFSPNHIHGGKNGFQKQLWHCTTSINALEFTRISNDGEERYPGNLFIKVSFKLSNLNELTITYSATSDKDTIINLTNHSYFNLNGHQNGNILDHLLYSPADRYAPCDENNLPTGEILSVHKTPFCFNSPKLINQDILCPSHHLSDFTGYDHKLFLPVSVENDLTAILYSKISGIKLSIFSTQPCFQLYTGNHLDSVPGKNMAFYEKNSGICIENQLEGIDFELKNFNASILRKNCVYNQKTKWKFELCDKIC